MTEVNVGKRVSLDYEEHQALLAEIKRLKEYIHEAEVNGKIRVRKVPIYSLYNDGYSSLFGNKRYFDKCLMSYDEIEADENELLIEYTKRLDEANTELSDIKEKHAKEVDNLRFSIKVLQSKANTWWSKLWKK